MAAERQYRDGTEDTGNDVTRTPGGSNVEEELAQGVGSVEGATGDSFDEDRGGCAGAGGWVSRIEGLSAGSGSESWVASIEPPKQRFLDNFDTAVKDQYNELLDNVLENQDFKSYIKSLYKIDDVEYDKFKELDRDNKNKFIESEIRNLEVGAAAFGLHISALARFGLFIEQTFLFVEVPHGLKHEPEFLADVNRACTVVMDGDSESAKYFKDHIEASINMPVGSAGDGVTPDVTPDGKVLFIIEKLPLSKIKPDGGFRACVEKEVLAPKLSEGVGRGVV